MEPGTQSGNEGLSIHASRARGRRFAAGPGLADRQEINRLRGGDPEAAAQANGQTDAAIGPKDRFRKESDSAHGGDACEMMPEEGDCLEGASWCKREGPTCSSSAFAFGLQRPCMNGNGRLAKFP